jgi:hypothetical protein
MVTVVTTPSAPIRSPSRYATRSTGKTMRANSSRSRSHNSSGIVITARSLVVRGSEHGRNPIECGRDRVRALPPSLVLGWIVARDVVVEGVGKAEQLASRAVGIVAVMVQTE